RQVRSLVHLSIAPDQLKLCRQVQARQKLSRFRRIVRRANFGQGLTLILTLQGYPPDESTIAQLGVDWPVDPKAHMPVLGSHRTSIRTGSQNGRTGQASSVGAGG